MPRSSIQIDGFSRVLDARPDRIDFRDRTYRPPLQALPPQFPLPQEIHRYFGEYHENDMVLDQKSEGACVGFGLAAMINFVQWREHQEKLLLGEQSVSPERVSPRMLYDNARLYDEWEGEDYSGSSCRGGMKGWHKHGICAERLFPYSPNKFIEPDPFFLDDAATRPLGAYYRIEKTSVSDIQAAICESGAVFASARVHAGWNVGRADTSVEDAVIIQGRSRRTGGHAFAFVGYCAAGFFVQNSWGVDWGYKGFAILPYDDWVRNGSDAWVAARGAPTFIYSEKTTSHAQITASSTSPALIGNKVGLTQEVTPWSEARALRHCIVTGNDGCPLRRLPGMQNGYDNLRFVLDKVIKPGLESGRKFAIYLHGGINDEEAGLRRARALGPWLHANNIEPLFIVWKTGILESIKYIAQDLTERVLEEINIFRSRGFGDHIIRELEERRDQTFELVARKLIARPVWTQIKQNAEASGKGEGALRQIGSHIKEFAALIDNFSVNIIAHSAGSILAGHLIEELKQRRLTPNPDPIVNCLALFAPACTIPFANKYFGKFGLDAGVIGSQSIYVDNLSDKLERDDNVQNNHIYGKSILYLVFRALESKHKTPLLGLERSWPGHFETALEDDFFGQTFASDLKTWASYVKTHQITSEHHTSSETLVRRIPDVSHIKTTHGSFDNDIILFERTIMNVLNKSSLITPIYDLSID